MEYVYEYIWLDSDGQTRSKTRVSDGPPVTWNYDGSSTNQATANESEVLLIPIKTMLDPFRRNENSFLVLCETSWEYDTRKKAREFFSHRSELKPMFGFEQEFFMEPIDANVIQFPNDNLGKYYCGVGKHSANERLFLEKVLDNCLYSKIPITGYNFEVACKQAEFQVCAEGIDAADCLTLLRYILNGTSEEFNLNIEYACKPYQNRNGSGLHTNFSTISMRETEAAGDRLDDIIKAIEKLSEKHPEAMAIYGKNNDKRLLGTHETSSIEKFTYGVGDRLASVRIPSQPENRKYFEDRRPGSDADPYLVSSFIFKTTCLDDLY